MLPRVAEHALLIRACDRAAQRHDTSAGGDPPAHHAAVHTTRVERLDKRLAVGRGGVPQCAALPVLRARTDGRKQSSPAPVVVEQARAHDARDVLGHVAPAVVVQIAAAVVRGSPRAASTPSRREAGARETPSRRRLPAR